MNCLSRALPWPFLPSSTRRRRSGPRNPSLLIFSDPRHGRRTVRARERGIAPHGNDVHGRSRLSYGRERTERVNYFGVEVRRNKVAAGVALARQKCAGRQSFPAVPLASELDGGRGVIVREELGDDCLCEGQSRAFIIDLTFRKILCFAATCRYFQKFELRSAPDRKATSGDRCAVSAERDFAAGPLVHVWPEIAGEQRHMVPSTSSGLMPRSRRCRVRRRLDGLDRSAKLSGFGQVADFKKSTDCSVPLCGDMPRRCQQAGVIAEQIRRISKTSGGACAAAPSM